MSRRGRCGSRVEIVERTEFKRNRHETFSNFDFVSHSETTIGVVVLCARLFELAVALLSLGPFAWPEATQTPCHPAGGGCCCRSHGVVVSGKPAATAAGIKILQHGGNAADAGAATLLALSVTSVGAFCVEGEVPILVYSADRKSVKLLEGQGEAPRDPKAIAWYMEHGIPDGDVRQLPCLAPSMRSSPC